MLSACQGVPGLQGATDMPGRLVTPAWRPGWRRPDWWTGEAAGADKGPGGELRDDRRGCDLGVCLVQGLFVQG